MRWNRALFFFSILSGILLHTYSQKSSKVQNTIINYIVCDAKLDLREGCYVCAETTMTKINKICRSNVLTVR